MYISWCNIKSVGIDCIHNRSYYFNNCLFRNIYYVYKFYVIICIFKRSVTTEIVYLIIGLLLFCAYIAYDTKMMYMNFRDPNEKHDHYYHAINIFLNIINIFIKLIRLLIVFSNK